MIRILSTIAASLLLAWPTSAGDCGDAQFTGQTCIPAESVALDVTAGTKDLQTAQDDGDLGHGDGANCAAGTVGAGLAAGVDDQGAAQDCYPRAFASYFDDPGDGTLPAKMYISTSGILFDSSENYQTSSMVLRKADLTAVYDQDEARFGAYCIAASPQATATPLACLAWTAGIAELYLDMNRNNVWSLGEPVLGVGAFSINPISHRYPQVDKTADDTIGDGFGWAETSGYLFTNQGATADVVFTLPEPAEGMTLKFAVAEAYWLDIDPEDTGDQILGWTSAGGDKLGSQTVGSVVELIGISTTEWVAIKSGTWADRN
jgi:hypothetical protein